MLPQILFELLITIENGCVGDSPILFVAQRTSALDLSSALIICGEVLYGISSFLDDACGCSDTTTARVTSLGS